MYQEFLDSAITNEKFQISLIQSNYQETMLFCYLGKHSKDILESANYKRSYLSYSFDLPVLFFIKSCPSPVLFFIKSYPLLLLFILRSNDGSFCILANVSLAINYLLSRLYFVPLLHIKPYATVVSFPQLVGGGGLS